MKMAGYSGYSMSNNAVAAYNDGLLPASKIGKYPTHLIERFCQAAEWHHSSKNYNRVNFYSPEAVAEVFATNPAAQAALEEAKTASATLHLNCTVEWLEWTGSMKRPKCAERRETGCTVTVKGRTATITLNNKATFIKRLDTRGFSFKPVQA
jgi:hypothetical protein